MRPAPAAAPAARAVGPAPARWSAVSTPESPALLLVAHGSTDPRFLTTVEAIAARIRSARPGLAVRIGLLDHGPPDLAGVARGPAGAVAVPLLLSTGYHVRADLPAQAPDVTVAGAVGPDRLLADALADRLASAGYDGAAAVALVAAGSADPDALADVRDQARLLADRLGARVEPAFLSAGEPRLAALRPAAVASYLLAPGAFHDAAVASGAPVVSEPIGDHPAVAELALRRYDEAVSR